MADTLYILCNEWGRQFFGGVGTVQSQQVSELQRRGVSVQPIVWSSHPDWKAEQFIADGAIVVHSASQLLAHLPSGAVVIDHLYNDHPVRRAIKNRVQYEHGLRGGSDGMLRYPPERYHKARAVICVSAHELHEFKRRYPLQADIAEVVHNGYTNERPAIPASSNAIGYLGRYVPMKRVEFVKQAANETNLDAYFALAANGSGQLTAEQVPGTFFENLSQSELDKQFWPHIGLLCVPSSYEPFGMVVLEAMSRGIPVLAANTGGPSEIISPDSGLLFDSDGLDGEAAYQNFSSQLDRWQRMSQGERYILGRNAIRRAERFSAAAMVDRLLDVLHRRCDHTDFLPQPINPIPTDYETA